MFTCFGSLGNVKAHIELFLSNLVTLIREPRHTDDCIGECLSSMAETIHIVLNKFSTIS
jgi:hypothetical protein